MDSTRRRELLHLGFVFLGAALARLLIGRAMNGPAIFTDEYQYIEMARNLPQTLARGTGLTWDNTPAFFPCWLYPLLISPFLNLLTWDHAYHAIRFANVILMALTIFPVYGLARELASHRRALAAAALTALIPGLGYSSMVMTESLFLPVFTLAAWATFRAVLTPTAGRRLAAGLLCGLAFHVKPHGMLLPLALGATVILFELDRRRGAGLPFRAFLAGTLGGIARHWLTALGWVVAIVPRILVVKFMESPGQPLTIKSFLGNYSGLAQGRNHDYGLGFAALIMLAYLLAWAWCCGMLPAWAVIQESFRTLRRRERPEIRLMTILSVTLTGMMLYLVARHTLTNNAVVKLHERYFFHVIPLALVIFCAVARPLAAPPRLRWTWDIALVAMIVLNALVARCVRWTLPTDSPTFTGAMMMMMPAEVGFYAIAAFLVPVLAAVAIILFRARIGVRAQCLSVGLLLLAFNAGWYGYQESYLNGIRKPNLAIANKIGKVVGKGDQLIIMKDGIDSGLYWHIGLRNAGLAVTLEPQDVQWWENRFRVSGADGSILWPKPEKKTWLLAANTWRTTRKPVKSFDTCALYRVDGKAPLRLDPTQVTQFQKYGTTSETLGDGMAILNAVNLKILEKKVPKVMNGGRENAVQLKLRNDGRYALPGGMFRVAMGYHWSDPKRIGDWRAIVWDDGRQVSLPEWLTPGATCDITMPVLAPEKPGDDYVLGVQTMLIADRGERKLKYWGDGKRQGFLAWVKVIDTGTGEITPGAPNRNSAK